MKVERNVFLFPLILMVRCTVDLNIHQLQMVADHLEIKECKRLVKALHQNKFELDKFTDDSNEVDKPCLGLLLKWDRTDGEGKSFDDLAFRLGQIGRTDLSDKLSKSVYEEKAEKLDKTFLKDPFKKSVPTDSLLLDDVKKKKKKDVGKKDEGNKLAGWEIASITCGSVILFAAVCYVTYYFFGGLIVRMFRNYAPRYLVKWSETIFSEVKFRWNRLKKTYSKEVVGSRVEKGTRHISLAELNRNLHCYLNNNSMDALEYFDEMMRLYKQKTCQ
jgi:hypothetical protein